MSAIGTLNGVVCPYPVCVLAQTIRRPAWNKILTKTSVSMVLDQMISDGVSHDYARYRSISASMKRSLRRFARQIAIPKTVKDFHETCGYFCGQLKPSEVG